MICKYTNGEAQRKCDQQFSISMADLEVFIGPYYVRGIYGKGYPLFFVKQKIWNSYFLQKYEQILFF